MDLDWLMKCKCKKMLKRLTVKVSGYVVAKITKKGSEETKLKPLVMGKHNQILNLQSLLNAFVGNSSGVTTSSYGEGITLLGANGESVAELAFLTVTPQPTAGGGEVIFTGLDISNSAYTTTQQVLTTESSGYDIEIATADLSFTKNSDEQLYMTWVISFTVTSNPDNVTIVPSLNMSFTVPPNGYYSAPSLCQYTPDNGNLKAQSATGQSSPTTSNPSGYELTTLVTSLLFTWLIYSSSPGASLEYLAFVGTNSLALAVETNTMGSVSGVQYTATTIGPNNFVTGNYIFVESSNNWTVYTRVSPNANDSTISPVFVNAVYSGLFSECTFQGIVIQFTT
ncbi:hypothetical protein [Deltalipothrixvirus pozzuoliense]|uniref:Uncharacterized protein ORF338 n=1 Tax=Acidianus filamentous virus 2 (isolate Italy/Pozzuoli) TaxID=654910 RepID=Y338_AFV2P|nr:hypothetical protein AFV2_gp35 [Acidianus filamentous virus 2]Q573D4.1 RecName: Full=Uncharacterized protein ORF338 [Acidianus filamentous virus 2 (isolate Pozzuoli)]CAH69422.1 hypothetical protein [Acidianus filamentous virus 2]